MKFQHCQLPSGLTLIAETNPAVHSVAAGFFVRAGSRDETEEISGVSHFLEHMAFKGDDRFSADDINRVFDEIGAKYNASTSEEVTMYYAAVLPEYLERALELLSALLQPALRQEDFDMEKNVILEEISMYEDQPSFTCYDHIMATHFNGHPLGQSILGSQDSITALTSEQMRRYHASRYHTGNIVLAVAGNCDFDHLLQLVEKHCSRIPSGITQRTIPHFNPQQAVSLLTRESSVQQHLMQMGPAPRGSDPLRFAAELLSVIVGDDSGSRLFWELVDPGHVETCDLGFSEYDGDGAWMSYLSCAPDDAATNLERCAQVFAEVNAGGVTAEELEQARNKVASRIVLRGERPMGRLSSLGSNWLYRQEYRSIADDMKIIRSVTQEQIHELLRKYPLRMTTTAGVGPLSNL
ncbi:MAG: Protease 3 precursor [Planctomycetota bacterium]|jgi:predicted Zn-dependent peptidase